MPITGRSIISFGSDTLVEQLCAYRACDPAFKALPSDQASRKALGGPLATRLLDAVERSAAGLGRTRP